MRLTGIFLMASMFSSVSLASGSGTGSILGYIPSTTGSAQEFFVVSTSAITGTPSCNTSSRFALSSADPKYKSTLASVMAAFYSGAQVHIVGNGTCNVFSNAEDIAYICFGSIPC